MPFPYADAGSGPSAGGIGWFNFGTLTIAPGQTVFGLTGTLNDGTTVTFDLTSTNILGAPRIFNAVATPTWTGTFFGNGNYTNILGNVALETQQVFLAGSTTLTMNNIVVLDANNNPVPNYTVLVADAESTGLAETWTWTTNGTDWDLFATLGNSSNPLLVLLNQVATITGTLPVNQNDFVLSTQNPTVLNINSFTNSITGGRQAVAIGFAVTKVAVQKNVGQRIDPADQFALDIAGTPNDQATTTGAANGIQAETAVVYGIPGNIYTIDESMAPGSVSALGDYTVIVSATNATPAGSIPPIGSLPVNFTPVVGDDVTYTILNAAPQTFVKTVDKAFTDVGEVLTYTVVIDNPNNFPVNNVVFTDATPLGTTYIGNLIVSAPYVGVDPATGLTITTIPANDAATVSWQVQVDSFPPVPNPIANVGNVIAPGGTSGSTNVVTTQVNHAFISIGKMVDKAYAEPGDILTYTLILNNFGNVAANNVVITDPIPNGTVYVLGSLAVSVPYIGSPATAITLTNPIAAGQTVTISFQVKVTAIPLPNPNLNTATADFTYTVNPQLPDGVSDTSASNTVSTLIFTNNYSQEISDLIHSIALQEAALAAIANAEGAKMQKIVAMPNVTPETLACLNKNVADMIDSIALLEAILRQKLSVVD